MKRKNGENRFLLLFSRTFASSRKANKNPVFEEYEKMRYEDGKQNKSRFRIGNSKNERNEHKCKKSRIKDKTLCSAWRK